MIFGWGRDWKPLKCSVSLCLLILASTGIRNCHEGQFISQNVLEKQFKTDILKILK